MTSKRRPTTRQLEVRRVRAIYIYICIIRLMLKLCSLLPVLSSCHMILSFITYLYYLYTGLIYHLVGVLVACWFKCWPTIERLQVQAH